MLSTNSEDYFLVLKSGTLKFDAKVLVYADIKHFKIKKTKQFMTCSTAIVLQ